MKRWEAGTPEALREHFLKLARIVNEKGGEVKLDLGNGRWRKLHFVRGCDYVFIVERFLQTVTALTTWRTEE